MQQSAVSGDTPALPLSFIVRPAHCLGTTIIALPLKCRYNDAIIGSKSRHPDALTLATINRMDPTTGVCPALRNHPYEAPLIRHQCTHRGGKQELNVHSRQKTHSTYASPFPHAGWVQWLECAPRLPRATLKNTTVFILPSINQYLLRTVHVHLPLTPINPFLALACMQEGQDALRSPCAIHQCSTQGNARPIKNTTHPTLRYSG